VFTENTKYNKTLKLQKRMNNLTLHTHARARTHTLNMKLL